MSKVDPTRLRDVIGVALAGAPRQAKKHFADRYSPKEQEASRQIAEAVTESVLTYLHHLEHPTPLNSTPPGYYRGSG